MSKYRLVPHIREKIKEKLTMLNLDAKDKNVEWFIKKKHHTYFSSVINKKTGKKFFFKAKIMDDQKVTWYFRRMIWFYQNMRSFRPRLDTLFVIHKFIKGEATRALDWILLDYFEGRDFHDPNKSKIDLKDKYIKIFLNAVLAVQKKLTPRLKKFSFRDKWLYFFDHSFFQKKLSDFSTVLSEEKRSFLKKQILKYKNILDKNTNTAVHGDLNPKNVVRLKENRFLLCDWEDVHFGNSAFDFAMIWVSAWRDLNWRQKFYKAATLRFSNSLHFQTLFWLDAFLLTLKEIKYGPKIAKKTHKETLSELMSKLC